MFSAYMQEVNLKVV